MVPNSISLVTKVYIVFNFETSYKELLPDLIESLVWFCYQVIQKLMGKEKEYKDTYVL